MLRKFKVSNFKNFENEFVFDLSETNGYEFNTNCIKNGIVNSALIYGHNGVGKSNLGLAIFDIIGHLTDKGSQSLKYLNYLNAYNKSEIAEFYYEFKINNKIVKYEYKKTDYKTLVFEKFSIDNEVLILFDRLYGNQFFVKLKGAETLNTTISAGQLSALKYIKNNTVLKDDKNTQVFMDFFKFIDSMLYCRSLEDRVYLGLEVGSWHATDDIIERDNVKDFEKFLNEAGVECKLDIIKGLDKKLLVFNFNGKKLLFEDTMSTGTLALTIFYFWFQRIREESNVSFLFIDEFDAFYHHELSALVVKKLKETGVQFILTTHNTSIITNDLLRPDCYFLMNKRKIQSLAKCTPKELREAHNIEKMYKAKVFNVD
jgi:AAA15 family ATPase/GTPase